MFADRGVPGAEASAQGVGVRGRICGHPAQPGPVGGLGEPARPPHQPHPVGPGVGPVGRRDRRGRLPAERRGVPDEQLRQQAHPVDRVMQGAGGRVGGAGGPQRRVEQGLHVDQDRMRAAGDEVLVVEVRTVQRVQQGQQSPLTPVELPGLRLRRAGPLLHELDPAVRAPVQHPQYPQLRGAVQRTEPLGQGVEVPVRRERTRLVDQPRASGEPQQHHGPPPAVAVARPGLDADERPGPGVRTEGPARGAVPGAEHPGRAQEMPVGGEPGGHLREGVPGVEAGRGEEAGQHGVGGDERAEAVATGGQPNEVPEAILGFLAAQPAQPPRLVQLGDECARRDAGEPPRQLPPEVGQDERAAVHGGAART